MIIKRLSTSHWSLPSKLCTLQKKVTQHDFHRLIFLLSWICIHQVRYPWKACLFAFWLMLYLLGLFHWGACKESKLGAMSKRESCKIDWIVSLYGKCMLYHILCFPLHPYPLPILCTEIFRNKRSGWNSNSGAILEHLLFDIASNIITLRTFLSGNHNK